MPSNPEYRPRLTFDLDTDERKQRVARLIPWGIQKNLYIAITDIVLDTLDGLEERDRGMAIAAIISGKITILDLLRSKEK